MPEIGYSTTFKLAIEGVSSPPLVASFEAFEAISTLFEVNVTFTSPDVEIDVGGVVGKSAVLTLDTDGTSARYFNGIVSRCRHDGQGKSLDGYHLTIVPKLWRLRYRHDARIFQEMAVPDIIKKVLDGAGLASGDDYQLSLSGSYSPREYCVQYRESDFAFISRLMEEEGIRYFFDHSEDKHVLTLADTLSGSTPIVSPDTIPFKGALGAMAHGEGVSRFSYAEEVRPGKVTLRDFNFKKPSLSLQGQQAGKVDADLELYDYPGEYDVPGDGATYANVRLEEWQTRRAVADGESGCVRFAPGYLFTLSDAGRDAENQTYLITALRQHGTQAQMGGPGTGGEGRGYHNSFEAIPSTVPFRPARVTPRPMMRGVQTAIVTGPGGEEIYTDEHGRVKVQFHWDRLGTNDDKSSCWIRVSQVWAGAGWGAMWIPRIGHEVIVDFLEGDPDRPIITGRVYHATNVPPYALPAEKTKSTIKSNSSMGGGGSNELRFEDKKGSEEIWLHGQKDWNIKIEHDKNQNVGHDETKQVGRDETYEIGRNQALQVDNDRTKTVKHDQSETVGNDKKISVGRNHTESIGNNESNTITANATRTVGGNQDVTVGGASSLSVTGGHSLTVGSDISVEGSGALNASFSKDSTTSVGGAMSTTVGKDYAVVVSGAASAKITGDAKENIDGEHEVTVGKKFVLKVGSGTITVNSDGTITIDGKDINVKGSGTINVQASSKVTLKSDGPVDVQASGAVQIKGSNVAIN